VRACAGLALACVVSACAPSAPLLSGGRTTPHGRSDLAAGAAFRVPVGDLVAQPAAEDRESALAYGAPGGAAPLGSVRHGVTRDVEIGADIVGTTLRGSVRGQLELGSSALLVLGAMPLVGLAGQDEDYAVRAGGLVPIVVSVDLSSLYEAWIGVRVGLEHVTGSLGGRAIELSGLRTGGVIGLGVGFRRLHVLLELAIDHEYWWGAIGGSSVERNGVALTPAFAVRLRL
jgi:hypothetical protein